VLVRYPPCKYQISFEVSKFHASLDDGIIDGHHDVGELHAVLDHPDDFRNRENGAEAVQSQFLRRMPRQLGEVLDRDVETGCNFFYERSGTRGAFAIQPESLHTAGVLQLDVFRVLAADVDYRGFLPVHLKNRPGEGDDLRARDEIHFELLPAVAAGVYRIINLVSAGEMPQDFAGCFLKAV
jgi:hypothetical protein